MERDVLGETRFTAYSNWAGSPSAAEATPKKQTSFGEMI